MSEETAIESTARARTTPAGRGTRRAGETRPLRTPLESALVFGAATAGRILSAAGLTARGHRLDVTRIEHSLGLGAGRAVRAVVLADLHLVGSPASYGPLLAEIAQASPDLILFAGDTFEAEHSYDLIDVFEPLRPPLGKIAALGNWEYAPTVDTELVPGLFERAGVQLLVNEAIRVGGLTIVGLDDPRDGAPDYDVAVTAAAEGPTLTLSHCPIGFDALNTRAAELGSSAPHLVVAGHTHGGQIAPFGRALFCPPGSGRYVKGWYRDRTADMFVSRGIGFSGARLRIGSRPELVVVDLM